jgi:hypothetical protein
MISTGKVTCASTAEEVAGMMQIAELQPFQSLFVKLSMMSLLSRE